MLKLIKVVILKKIFNKKNILIFLIVLVLGVVFYFTYSLMNEKISETYFYVLFDSNGGSRVNSEKVIINETAVMPEPPTKKGYAFKYWTLDNKEYDFNTKVRSNITLVALWELETDENRAVATATEE